MNPCHLTLATDGCRPDVLRRLQRWHRWRTLAWTTVALLSASRLV